MANDVTPAQLRAAAAQALEEPGARRKRLLAELDQLETELRPLIARAVAVEIPTRQISDITGLSRVTIGKWVRE